MSKARRLKCNTLWTIRQIQDANCSPRSGSRTWQFRLKERLGNANDFITFFGDLETFSYATVSEYSMCWWFFCLTTSCVLTKTINVAPSFIQAWDWHCQKANSGGVNNIACASIYFIQLTLANISKYLL